ncbi:helix-turn-helix domain-containing protein [Streptomyces sp. H27-H5]|uniref:helix-turn-helix domain-containing protein n=1 Tax=Streptomyces sp. H27-H5 TaxID=2996460 RepID=UPI00226E805D|nr:helix-turn-helix domain-containing protein [Streptomyces sp. H27-H5]MCY0962962.1 helix-turn-helix domain-containing protein [Streptomyces sp. H27-H5]
MRIRRERLRELRRMHGWTQGQVAAALECSRATVSTWETTGGMPRPARLQRLADLFNVPICEIIDEEDTPPLRRLRTAAGLRQKDVAKLLGVGTPTYCDVETARQGVPERWIPILSEAFNVTTDAIINLARIRILKSGRGGVH